MKPIKPNSEKFNTKLNKKQSESFSNVSKEFANLTSDKEDYDTQGLYKELYKKHKGNEDEIKKALTPGSEYAHVGTDRYKKPNHPTFSVESKYSNILRRGGKWDKEGDSDVFKARKRNIKNMNASYGSPENYMNYAEDYNGDGVADVKLIKPNMKKYRMGVQEVAVDTSQKKDAGAAALEMSLQGAAMGASLAAINPVAGAVGAGVGAVAGATVGFIKQKSINRKIGQAQQEQDRAKNLNAGFDASYRAANNDYVESDTTMGDTRKNVLKAKKGLKVKSSRVIEVEGGELATKPGSLQIDKQFVGNSHAKGGIKVSVPNDIQPGSAIIPKDKAEEFKKGSKEVRASIINNLPKDNGDKKKRGSVIDPEIPYDSIPINQDYTNKNYSMGNSSTIDNFTWKGSKKNTTDTDGIAPMEGVRVNTVPSQPPMGSSNKLPTTDGGFNNAMKVKDDKPSGIDFTKFKDNAGNNTSTTKLNMDKVGAGVGTVAALAPTIYNTARYLSESSVKEPVFFKPSELLNTNVDTTYQRNQLERSTKAATDNLSNYSAGNISGISNNIRSIQMDKMEKLNDISNTKYQQEQSLRQYNNQLINRDIQAKTQAEAQAYDNNLQHGARRNDFLAQAMTGASDYSQAVRNKVASEKVAERNMEFQAKALGDKDWGVETYRDSKGKLQFRRYKMIGEKGDQKVYLD
jgi:hypothetical protein